MYTTRTGLVLGFHGTDEKIVNDVLRGRQDLSPSTNAYDWLGNGIYFWDNNPARAREWAAQSSRRAGSFISKPDIIGSIIDLGYCLDLLDSKYLPFLSRGYNFLYNTVQATAMPLPKNRGDSPDLLLRELDCAVIETVHQTAQEAGQRPFDSVRGMFSKGKQLYPTAGFREKDHIQLCIRNLDCIKGYFLPLERIAS